MYPNNKKPMSTWKKDVFSDEDKRKIKTKNFRSPNSGHKEKASHYPDGSTTYHGGGPAGSVRFNDIGDEC